ncbi:MAG: hypothetical protein JWN19_2662, partial [Arthrobacter sp.]|nr:hypothetical protein [Arthrobacter sp.]
MAVAALLLLAVVAAGYLLSQPRAG